MPKGSKRGETRRVREVRIVLKPVIPKILTHLTIKPTFVISAKHEGSNSCYSCLDKKIYVIKHKAYNLIEHICSECFRSTVIVGDEGAKIS